MFPDMLYDAKGNGKDTFMKDIFRRVKVKSNAKGNIVEFDYYDVQDGETPEMIAFKYYGDAELHWTILVINDIIDYYTDWPMSVQRFEQYMNDKYENPAAVMMYETTEVTDALGRQIVQAGLRVPSNYQVTYYDGTASAGVTVNPVSPVTYYQYEERLNSEKEKINVIKPAYVEEFVRVYVSSLHKGGTTVLGTSKADIKID